MAFENRVDLPGSARQPMFGARELGPVAPDHQVQVTVVLRRKDAAGSDEQLLERFAHEHSLTLRSWHPNRRSAMLLGSAATMSSAFGVTLTSYEIQGTGVRFRGRTGSVMIPQELSGIVIAVLGLDTRPVAKPHFRRCNEACAEPLFHRKKRQPTTFTPPQLAALYNFPHGLTGEGETVGIIELGGGYRPADLTTYFKGLGVAEPNIVAVSVDGAINAPGSDADGEVMLDIEVAGSVAPGAKIAVYFAANTDQGFLDAITTASHDTVNNPSILSISWGGPEDSWTDQARGAMNTAFEDAAALGITVTVAAGDSGADDGVGDGALHVDFPASSPWVLSCGGTKVIASGSTIASEVTWNELSSGNGGTGGGVSLCFPVPDYQLKTKIPAQQQTGAMGRGVPDVSGDADPISGYIVRVDGQQTVIGGTSAVAPLWAGLFALINQKLGAPVGFANPKLYTFAETTFRDIILGTNGAYTAGPGWDACTGLGSPNGTALLNAFLNTPADKTKPTT